MKRLVIDGNSVYEIDLDCVRKHRPPENCELSAHVKDYRKPEKGSGRCSHTRMQMEDDNSKKS